MKCAILRGFDFPARDVSDQLRFCNPLLAFEEGTTAPMYFARDLDWQHGDEDRTHGLTRVDTDEVESFGTHVSVDTLHVSQGKGVVLMGDRFFAATRMAGIEVDRSRYVDFTELPEIQCRIGVADVDSFRAFAKQLTDDAALVFDDRLFAMTDWTLPKGAEAALFLLRKCGFTPPTRLALRQLVAAYVTRQTDAYRRLLIRFSIELKEREDSIHQRVERHIRVARYFSALSSETRRRLKQDLYPSGIHGSVLSTAHGRAEYRGIGSPFAFGVSQGSLGVELTESLFDITAATRAPVSSRELGTESVLPVSKEEGESFSGDCLGGWNVMTLPSHGRKDSQSSFVSSMSKVYPTRHGLKGPSWIPAKPGARKQREMTDHFVALRGGEELELGGSKFLASSWLNLVKHETGRGGSESRSSDRRPRESEEWGTMYRRTRDSSGLAHVQVGTGFHIELQ